jgi:hypothetical protein
MQAIKLRRGDSSSAERQPNQVGGGGSTPTSPLDFRIGEWRMAKHLVLRFHYSGRVRTSQVVGTFHRLDRNALCVAACLFSPPSARWREQRILELSRLVRAPRQCVPLTRLIKLTIAQVKQRDLADLLISYADRTNGHHGGVYQAAGWKYHGMRAPYRDGVIHRGRFVPARTCNQRWGTNVPRNLRKLGVRASAHFDKGKHLYWRALNGEGEAKAARLGLLDRPYPKPQPARSGKFC